MLTVTIVLCSWCRSPRPIAVEGADSIPPGKHPANVQVSHGICPICEVIVDSEISKIKKGDASHSGTPRNDDATRGSTVS